MVFDLPFWRALADYGVLFPEVANLGTGTPPSAWLTEYNRVRVDAFGSVLITSAGGEGTQQSGAREFPQATLIDALHCRRFELDDDYDLPAHLVGFNASKARVALSGARRHVIRFS